MTSQEFYVICYRNNDDPVKYFGTLRWTYDIKEAELFESKEAAYQVIESYIEPSSKFSCVKLFLVDIESHKCG
jgi:hypothetical protein